MRVGLIPSCLSASGLKLAGTSTIKVFPEVEMGKILTALD
jgi:hypothetical protein